MAKHKVFISHYHADDEDVKKFTDYFCEKHPKHTEPGIREYYH